MRRRLRAPSAFRRPPPATRGLIRTGHPCISTADFRAPPNGGAKATSGINSRRLRALPLKPIVWRFARMSISESLPGHLLSRNGTKYLVVKVNDSTVVAAYRDKTGTLQRVLIPLAEALQCIDDLDEV